MREHILDWLKSHGYEYRGRTLYPQITLEEQEELVEYLRDIHRRQGENEK